MDDRIKEIEKRWLGDLTSPWKKYTQVMLDIHYILQQIKELEVDLSLNASLLELKARVAELEEGCDKLRMDENNLICPWCEDHGFDKIGLKKHLQWCKEFNTITLPKRVIDLSRFGEDTQDERKNEESYRKNSV